MKLLFGICLFLSILPVVAANAVEDGDGGKEIVMSDTEPVSHVKDVQFHANPKFTPPPKLNEKAFLENPLVDFTVNTAWKARLYNCEGFLCLSRDQIVGKRPNLKLELTESRQGGRAELVPTKPVKAPREFDTFMLLGYGKNLTALEVVFRKPDGQPFKWRSGKNMNEMLTGWNLLRVKLSERLPAGTQLESIGFTTVPFRANRAPDIYHLEQFDVTIGIEHLRQEPLRFNTGKVVEIPVSPDGALPQPREAVSSRVWRDGDSFKLRYENADGIGVTYIYRPKAGTLDDVSVSGDSSRGFQPAAMSGPVFDENGKGYDIRREGEVSAVLVEAALSDNRVKAVWQYRFGNS